jgi:hypothetical protein
VRGSVKSSLFAGLVNLVEQLHGLSWHDRRDSMLVDELGVSIPAQKDTEIVEPRDDALKLHAVDQKDRQGNFVLPDIIEKSVLEILRAIARH